LKLWWAYKNEKGKEKESERVYKGNTVKKKGEIVGCDKMMGFQ
jgi:hypothetical protein